MGKDVKGKINDKLKKIINDTDKIIDLLMVVMEEIFKEDPAALCKIRKIRDLSKKNISIKCLEERIDKIMNEA